MITVVQDETTYWDQDVESLLVDRLPILEAALEQKRWYVLFPQCEIQMKRLQGLYNEMKCHTPSVDTPARRSWAKSLYKRVLERYPESGGIPEDWDRTKQEEYARVNYPLIEIPKYQDHENLMILRSYFKRLNQKL